MNGRSGASRVLTLAAACAFWAVAAPASTSAAEVEKIDWSTIKAKNLRLFSPAQSNYEWLRTPDHKKANKEVTEGQACLNCHKGEQKSLGGILSAKHPLEPDPIEGKKGYMRLKFQAAHDATYLYLRASWKTEKNSAGNVGNFMRFNGEEWEWFGNHRQHEVVLDDEQPAISPDRLGIMIGDGAVPMYEQQGCWMTCHESMAGMPEEADEDEVAEHPVIGAMYKKFGATNTTVRKYIPASRSEATEWDAVRSPAELGALRDKGAFLDLIIWDAALTGPGGFAADFNVLDTKTVDAGGSALLPNGKMLGGPAFIFDAATSGHAVLSEDDLADDTKTRHLIVGKTTASAEGHEFAEGDILPAHIIDMAKASGSAADVDYAKGGWNNGAYTVVLRRKLDTGNPLDDKVLKAGQTYVFSFSIHDAAAGKRGHQVSFPLRVSIGEGKADVQAVTLK